MRHTVYDKQYITYSPILALKTTMIVKNIFKAQTNTGGNGTGTQNLNRDTDGENTG